MRILVLGAGFGGLELATTLSEEFGDEHEVVLLDQSEFFVFGFSKLDVMFGRKLPADVLHPYRDLNKPGLTQKAKALRAFVYLAQVLFSFFCMMLAMTFSTFIVLAVILGFTVGKVILNGDVDGLSLDCGVGSDSASG